MDLIDGTLRYIFDDIAPRNIWSVRNFANLKKKKKKKIFLYILFFLYI